MLDFNVSSFVFFIYTLSAILLIFGVHTKNQWYILQWLIIVGNIMLVNLLIIISTLSNTYDGQQLLKFLIFSLLIFSANLYGWICVSLYYITLLKLQSLVNDNDKVSELEKHNLSFV